MPSSATLQGNHVADGDEYAYLNWQVASQDVANNRSLINWQAGWHFTTYSCRGLRQGQATIKGTTVYHDFDSGDGVHNFSASHDHRPALQTASGSLYVSHNSDGTCTLTATVGMIGFSAQNSSGSGSWALPTIPRFSGAPSTPIISDVDGTSFDVTFSDGAGGAPIDGREIAYGTVANVTDSGTTIVSSDGSTSITGLANGTTYYVWARTHNDAGYSPWSSMASATTWRAPDPPTAPRLSNVTQKTVTVEWDEPFDGGTPITSYTVGWGTSPSSPSSTVAATSPKTITGLTPGTKYYFFVRASNSFNTSAWSVASSATTIAGAYVLVGGVWKKAVPYVRVSGVWKVAEPWTKSLGVWIKNIS